MDFYDKFVDKFHDQSKVKNPESFQKKMFWGI